MSTSSETPNSSPNSEEKIEIKFWGFKICVQNPKSKPFIYLLVITVLIFLIVIMLCFPAILIRGLILFR